MAAIAQLALIREAYVAELEAPSTLGSMYRLYCLERMLNKALRNRTKS